MAMTTTLKEMMLELSDEDIKDVRKRARSHIKAMQEASRLDELRRAVEKPQGEIAAAMGIGQNAVSQMEKRQDIQLSTLSRYVQSLGFQLELSVVAKSGERVALKKFKPWLASEVEATITAKKVSAASKVSKGKTGLGDRKKAAAANGVAAR
jgi:DNA-binding Xre family transcriptional regulator